MYCGESLLFKATEHTRLPYTSFLPSFLAFSPGPPRDAVHRSPLLARSLLVPTLRGRSGPLFPRIRFWSDGCFPLQSTSLAWPKIYYASDKDMVEDYELQVPLRELGVVFFFPRRTRLRRLEDIEHA